MKIESSPRPDDESRASWRALIRSSLPEGEQYDFDRREFVPCFTCSSAPGAPSLCRGCLANRQSISELHERQQELLATIVRVTNETPFSDEAADALKQRGALVAEVGTAKASAAEYQRQLRERIHVDAIWLRTDLIPEADKRQDRDPADQPQILRVLALVDGQWRVAIEYTVEATGSMISHISEGHALGNKPIDPLTTLDPHAENR